jgi:outer membrane receptor protein involved in Fe transport
LADCRARRERRRASYVCFRSELTTTLKGEFLEDNQKLTYAVLAALGANVGVAVAADTDTGGIEEIVVTAQRRSESLQNVPITIQAITGDQLKSLNVTSFDDLLRFTPNVTFSGNGPGTGNIFIRGLSSGGSGNQSQSTTAPFPNVALYLDDQSMQFPARNNDVYLVDMERVEILEGPQGTLFGGGAEAGAVRYITNKPKLDVTEGNANAGYGITAGGDPNSLMNATINIPLISDTLAVRAVIFSDRRGGYINNVPGTICNRIDTTDARRTALCRGHATNSQTYQGFRLSALYKFNDDWNLLLQQNYQNMDAEGYWAEYPNGVDAKQSGAAGCPAAANPYGCLGSPLPQNSIQAFDAGVRPRQVREYGLDPERQVRRPEGGLHRQLHGPQYRPAGRLFQLSDQRFGFLLQPAPAAPPPDTITGRPPTSCNARRRR